MALRPFRALSEVLSSTPASGGPLGLGRPGLNLITLRVKRQTGLLKGTVCPSLKYQLLGLNRVPFGSVVTLKLPYTHLQSIRRLLTLLSFSFRS